VQTTQAFYKDLLPMLTLLRRAEDLLIQVLRLVLLAFSIFVLFGMGHWIWDHYKPKKPDIATAGATALNWKDAPYDLKYMEEETGRDLSVLGNAVPMEKRLADPALRPDFRKADGLLRGFIYRDTAARKRVETENSSQGLDPIHPCSRAMPCPRPTMSTARSRCARHVKTPAATRRLPTRPLPKWMPPGRLAASR
jgi:hypothetical protein